MTFDGETTFQYSSPANLYYMDIANPIYKSSMMARPAINQIITCEIIAGNMNQTNSTNGMNQEANKIKFEKVTGTFNQHHPTLLQIAAIDDTGIYEGTTLLANKYAQISDIPTATSDLTNDSGFITINDIPQSSGVSEEDWDNSNETIAQELTNNRLEHLSINDNFSNYYTKTEADGRYATVSWANSRFVTQTDDLNRQQAIAAAFASSVQSTSVHNIWTGSQNDYDLITTPDINTLYIII